ncbi:DEAD/DEAH box helicase family protein [Candidatus Synechococcus calcipolaris G9]|uniref:DEAD/DEAH box helicase family protein n=1 Tax=Candidatus Synechococcus calcipolaris G9 TaxID=1497997 RepID=A0ABT6F1R0_9SYNE|nr:DEAD/DEAH box helicase family protein [Candidatus Synechococcus calcipolaris]MDG2991762.1 DEAD/DEAH box helicase family protein [Candidatus Synechococcus calcipolaris G9]
MKIQFDSQQQYQLDAVNAVVDVFDGQPLAGGQFETSLGIGFSGAMTEMGFGNQLELSLGEILANVQTVQKRHGIALVQPGVDIPLQQGMNFSIEMETGTGKTYVYLRTIHELNARYGFTKFIIVVPSVPIREGVLKNLEITKEHFQNLYGNQPFDYWVYNSKRVSNLRQFANSNQLQILVINIDAFNKKDISVIHKELDGLSGHRPIEFIQATNPIVILDEPQNMESDKAKEAIASLNPLCTLRYSATHKNLYNLLYRLDPVKAYDMKLVKQITVTSALEENSFNQPYVYLESIKATKTKITAKLAIDIQKQNSPTRKTVSISKNGVDLYELSGGRELYRRYVVDCIDAGFGYISFTNGVSLNIGETIGNYGDDLMKAQIRETIKEHLDKELAVKRQLPDRPLKVLSLFFIDRVANYAATDGKLRQWFIEIYQELSQLPRYQNLALPAVEEIHNGYFAEDRQGNAKDTSGSTVADDTAYELIMKDKERLLSPTEPLRFIFSHSALREGWDNPNVFQICMLREVQSKVERRQTIGRGLRLPVDTTGIRVFDPTINRLTVIANESYADFARALQTEIEEDCGVKFEGRIKNNRDRQTANLIPKWRENTDFLKLWERIKHKTRYSVEYDTQTLIGDAARQINQMPAITAPQIRLEKVALGYEKTGITSQLLSVTSSRTESTISTIPDLISYLQRETELTRETLSSILLKSDRLSDIFINPQQFLDLATRAIRFTMQQLMVNGIKYERIAGEEYEMRLFEDKEISGFIDNMLSVNHSIYDAIECQSDIERQFAEILDGREDIKLFIKLPPWFKVQTPLGTYNPDWAIVKQVSEDEQKLYLIRETKGTKEQLELRVGEGAKIYCGQQHFDVLDVDFDVVTNASEI